MSAEYQPTISDTSYANQISVKLSQTIPMPIKYLLNVHQISDKCLWNICRRSVEYTPILVECLPNI